jgi:hypothetical protein
LLIFVNIISFCVFLCDTSHFFRHLFSSILSFCHSC